MDELIKEPDRMEFVDSDHIMNYLQNMDEGCDNSLMGSGENLGDGGSFDKDFSRLNSADELLDNLIKSVCAGINDSTLISKDDAIGIDSIADNDSSDMDIIAKSVSLHDIENALPSETGVKDIQAKEASALPEEVGVKDSQTKETSSNPKGFLGTLGAIVSYKLPLPECADSISTKISKNGGNKNNLQLTSIKDNEIIVLDEKRLSGICPGKEKPSEADECEIIEEKKTASSCEIKIGTETIDCSANLGKETSDEAFHINDNIKRGLSKLTFPSKTSIPRISAKKKMPPLRPISTTRITLAEALEKAQGVQTNVQEDKAEDVVDQNMVASSNEYEIKGSSPNMFENRVTSPNSILENRLTSPSILENKDQSLSKFPEIKAASDDSKGSENESVVAEETPTLVIENVMSYGQLSPGSLSTCSSVKSIEERVLDTNLSGSSHSSSPILLEDLSETVKAKSDLQDKAKNKSKGGGRCKLTSEMSDLLRFTFDHEHFPSSVNMARLAKIMGVTWSQIRNWFTNRRVENKKNGIFPRDKVLDYCSYCSLTLKTEAEQKGHLFAAQHIRKILGTEYAGDDHVEVGRWKRSSAKGSDKNKLSSQKPAVEKVNNYLKLSGGEISEESVADKLGKRWKDSFLMSQTSKFSKVNTVNSQTWDSDKAIKEEVKEEYDREVDKEVSTVLMKSENEENQQGVVLIKTEKEENHQGQLHTMDGLNSKHLSLSSCTTGKGGCAGGTIVNRYVNSSQDSKFTYSNTDLTNPKGLQVKKPLNPMKWSDTITKEPSVESNQSFGRGSRIKQKESLSYIAESLLGFQCPTCIKIFQTEWQMIKHSMIHLLCICDICEKTFLTENDLKLHLHDHLTGAYEEEKYYCQFSCKVCHSLKCECYEPHVNLHKEEPKAFERPQKAKRSKRTFSTKPYSGMNDHLRVTFGKYHKSLQKSKQTVLEKSISEIQNKLKEDRDIKNNISNRLNHSDMKDTEVKRNVNKEEVVVKSKGLNNDKTELKPVSSSVQPKFSIEKVLLIGNSSKVKPETVSSSNVGNKVKSLPEQKTTAKSSEKSAEVPQKKSRGRPVGRKSGKDSTCLEGDFYYMCEVCDSSFLSKGELQEHMFFHRLKARSRRGDKRTLERSGETNKKAKLDSTLEEGDNFEGFKKFSCTKCNGQFAKEANLHRHNAQVHSDDLTVDASELLKCNYCGKTYKRERELRRHLKNACPGAPKYLKTTLSTETTLLTLHDRGDGPHFTVVSKNSESVVESAFSSPLPPPGNGPYKCRYCHVVTKHEKEMKDHIWKDCPSTPNIIKKRSQQGTSLEELGFSCQEDEVEDMIISGVTAAIETDVEGETTVADTSSAAESGLSPSSSKSKDPLVCAYCGIWYYRKVSLVKHMMERCIAIPARDRVLLDQGAELYDAVQGNNFCEIADVSGSPKRVSTKAFYKRVQGSDPNEIITSPEISTDSSKNQASSSSSRVSNEDLKSSNVVHQVMVNSKENVSLSSTDNEATASKVEPIQNKKITKQKGVKCNRCHESFISSDAVLAHSSVHHGPKKGLYKCKLCQERFLKYKQLREHVWLHTKETPYKCHICDAKYRLSDTILGHLASVHNYHKATEKNLFKWLPGRNGKYRTVDTPQEEAKKYETEKTLEGLDISLENLAEDLVVTDDMWTVDKDDEISLSKGNLKEINKTKEQKEKVGNVDSSSSVIENTHKDLDKISGCDNSDIVKVESQCDKKEIDAHTSKDNSKHLDVQTEQGSSKTVGTSGSVKKTEFSLLPKSTDQDEKRKTLLCKSNMNKDKSLGEDDDEGELFSGLSNLDSIIETVNLTDDSFLE